jgi:hypothetical protein
LLLDKNNSSDLNPQVVRRIQNSANLAYELLYTDKDVDAITTWMIADGFRRPEMARTRDPCHSQSRHFERLQLLVLSKATPR